MKKHVQITSFIVAGAWLVAALTVLYWSVKPYDIVSYNVEPIKVLNEDSVVHAGGFLRYEVDICKNEDAPATLTKTLVPLDLSCPEITIPSSESHRPVGCYAFESQVLIPLEAAGCEYSLGIEATYKPNPYREVTESAKTEIFYVLE